MRAKAERSLGLGRERERNNCAVRRRPRADEVLHDDQHQDRRVEGDADVRGGCKKNEAICSSGADATAKAEGSGAGWIAGTRNSLEICFERISAACREVGAVVRPPLHMMSALMSAPIAACVPKGLVKGSMVQEPKKVK